MLQVGLTGSIGVGKSFVTEVLGELGCHTIDADEIAREIVLPGSDGLTAVVDAFGTEVLGRDGMLDRKRMAMLVFADASKRQLLNAILHPLIIARQDEQMRAWETEDPKGIGVVDAALMIESGSFKRFDKLIVVHCRPEIQLQRLVARNGFSRDEAEKRISAQMPQEEKLKVADYCIDTSEGFAATQKQTEEVYRALQEIAQN